MRSWSGTHTFAAGGLVGFSLATYHPWLVFGAGVAVGLVLTFAARLGRELLAFLGARSKGGPSAAGPSYLSGGRRR